MNVIPIGRKRFWVCLILSSASLCIVTERVIPNEGTTSDLASTDAQVFAAACQRLITSRSSDIRRLIVVASDKANSHPDQMRQRFAITTLGAIQALEALSFLVNEIGLQNSPLVRPPGVRDQVLLLYPCAQALLNFRHNATEAICRELAEADADRVTQREILLYAYVIQLVERTSNGQAEQVQQRVKTSLAAHVDPRVRQRLLDSIVVPLDELRKAILDKQAE